MELSKKRMPKLLVNGFLAILTSMMVPLLLVNLVLLFQSYSKPQVPPNLFGITPLIVQSGSMADGSHREIQVGDLIFVKATDSHQVGDVVTFKQGDSYITHQLIVENTDGTFQTKGWANNTADDLPVAADDIVGNHIGTLAQAGNMLLFLQTPAGLIATIGIPVALLMLVDWIKNKFGKKGEKDE